MKMPSFGNRIFDTFESLLQPLQHASESSCPGSETTTPLSICSSDTGRQTHVRRPRDVAHRRRVITLLGEDARRGAKNEFQLLIE
jgi:hypothetical protein